MSYLYDPLLIFSLNTTTDGVAAVLETVYRLVRDVQTSTVKLDKRMSRMEARLDQVIASPDASSRRLDGLTDRLSKLEAANTEVKDKVSRLLRISVTGHQKMEKGLETLVKKTASKSLNYYNHY